MKIVTPATVQAWRVGGRVIIVSHDMRPRITTLADGCRRLRRFAVISILALFTWTAPCASAEEWLPTAGDSGGVWAAVNATDSVLILHRGTTDEPGRVYRVAELSATSKPSAMASCAGRLWIAYQPGEGQSSSLVQSVEWLGTPDLSRRTTSGEPMVGRYAPRRNEAALPGGVRLLSLTADAKSPWALVRRESASTTQPSTQPTTAPGPMLTQRMLRRAPRNLPFALTPQTVPATQETLPSGDQLLRLVNATWEPQPMPPDWPSGARAWVLSLRGDAEFPALVAITPQAQDRFVRIYLRASGEVWKGISYPIAAGDELVPLAVDGQLVFAQVIAGTKSGGDAAGDKVVLSVPRPGGPVVIGSMAVSGAAAIGLTTYGQSSALVQLSADQKLSYSVMDLQGALLRDNVQLDSTPPSSFDTPGLQVAALFLVGGMLLMFLFWRKDDPSQLAALGKAWVPCDPGRRSLAAAIDFAPCLFIGMILFEVPANEVVQRFFRLDTIADGVTPRLVVVGIYALYCTLGELFTARTIGKALLGVRVFSTDGKPPNVWQVIVRNVTKMLEIIAWPLLIMPMVRPHGQRLGDLAAKTIVVAARTEDDQPEDEL